MWIPGARALWCGGRESVFSFEVHNSVNLVESRFARLGGRVGRVRLEEATLVVSPYHSSRTLGYLFNLSDLVPSAI